MSSIGVTPVETDLSVPPGDRRPWTWLAIALIGALATTFTVVTSPWFETPFNRFTAILAILPAWALPIGSALLWRWRPDSRPAWLMFWLGLAWMGFIGTGALIAHGVLGAIGVVVQRAMLILLRPLLFWVLLSWPTGRLVRRDARAIVAFGAVCTLAWGLIPLFFEPLLGDASNPVMLADLPALVSAANAALAVVAVPLAAVVVAAVLWLRHEQLPTAARYATRPAVIAAVVFAIGEVTMVVSSFMEELTRDDDGWTLAGSVIVAIDWVRYAVPGMVLVAAAARTRRLASGVDRIRQIDAGTGEVVERLSDTVRRITDDPTARAAFASESGWLTSDGDVVDLGGRGRDVVRIERSGEAVAALDLAAVSVRRTASLEALARAAAENADYERIEARARARRNAALSARRAIVDLSDSTRYEIQRDLHDGAQQRLVGVNLRIRLGQRSGTDDVDTLRPAVLDELAGADRELSAIVDGEFATRSRSLADVLGELAQRMPLPVDAEIEAPDDLPDRVRAAAWFVASEAATNAVKYAHASRIGIRTNVADGHLNLSVSDDGVGGADAVGGGGLAGLRERVGALGGRLTIQSPPGRGTTVALDLPIGVFS